MPSVPSDSETHATKKMTLRNGEGLNGSAHMKEETGPKVESKKLENGKEIQNEEAIVERKWIRPDLASRCTWRLGQPSTDSPHSHSQM